jgi:zinc protease
MVKTLTSSVEELSKGVKVVALSRKFLRSASIVLLIGRGSYEDPVEGCADLTNRMRLRLTSRFGPLQLQATIDRLGATVDATTERDLMMLRAQVPAKGVANCLKFFAGLYSTPCFPDSEVAKEKVSRKLEYEKTREDPVLAAIGDAWEATFPGNPLGHPVTGYPHTIEKLTPRMLEKFDADMRERALLIVGIVGPQPESVLTDYVCSSFETIQNAPQVERIELGPRRDFNVLTRTLEVKQTTFAVGIVTSGVSSSDYPALLLIEDYLGSNRRYLGVLHKELREKRGLTYFAHSRLSALRDCGLLIAFAGVQHERVSEALDLMLKSIVELRDRSLPEKELEQLKTYHKQIMGTTLEVPYQAATWLASSLFRGGKVSFDSYVSDIDAVSSEMIMRAAGKCLTPSHMALSVAGCPSDEQTLMNIMKEEI